MNLKFEMFEFHMCQCHVSHVCQVSDASDPWDMLNNFFSCVSSKVSGRHMSYAYYVDPWDMPSKFCLNMSRLLTQH